MTQSNPEPQFPFIHQELIDALLQVFPDRLPRNADGFSSVERLGGQQDVIDRLIVEMRRQQGKLR